MTRNQAKVYIKLTIEDLETIDRFDLAKHYDVLCAYANGEDIECRRSSSPEVWQVVDEPVFHSRCVYRVKSGKWVSEHFSLDDERKLFSVVFSGTGRTLQDGNLMTLREAIEAARSAQRGHSQDGEANEGCLAITISPYYKNDYCCFYFAGLRELHLIENRGFIFIEHWQE